MTWPTPNLPHFSTSDWFGEGPIGKQQLREFRRDALSMSCDLEGETESQPIFAADDDERILARAQKFYEWILDTSTDPGPRGHEATDQAFDEVMSQYGLGTETPDEPTA